jgi:hypothetical protein
MLKTGFTEERLANRRERKERKVEMQFINDSTEKSDFFDLFSGEPLIHRGLNFGNIKFSLRSPRPLRLVPPSFRRVETGYWKLEAGGEGWVSCC